MRKRKILLMDLGRMKGGVETYLVRLSAILADDADLYCICILPELAKELSANGVRVTLLPKLGLLGKPLGFLITFFLLPMMVFTQGIDVVQVNGFLEAIFLPFTRMLGREAVYTRHGPFEVDLYKWYRDPLRFLPRFLSKLCVRYATRVVCVSEDTKKTVLGIVPEERAVVIQNWVIDLPSWRMPLPAQRRTARVLCVARLEEYKGIQLVIEALRKLSGAELIVVGDGSFRPQLEALASELNGASVRFAGYQSDPSSFFADADIFIMPSLGPEGSCLVAIEAMSYSLPCILSDLPVYEELTAGGRAALHFRSGDWADLRDKLSILIRDDQERVTYSREGYAAVKQKYTAEVARGAYQHVFGITPAPVEKIA